MPRDIDYYLEHPDEFGKLSDDQRASLYEGGAIEGDTTADDAAAAAAAQAASTADDVAKAAEGGDAPGATAKPADEPKAGVAPQGDDKAVVLSKDGKHTIPYSELADARERAAQLERENAVLREKQQPSQEEQAAAKAAEKLAAAPEPVNLDDLEGQYQDALLEGDRAKATEIRRNINAEIQRQAEAAAQKRIADDQAAQAAKAAQDAIQATAAKAIESYPFLDHKSPNANQQAITDVRVWTKHLVEEGMAPAQALDEAVKRFAPIYAPAKSQGTTEADAAKKAAEAIAAAKSGVPASLSAIPAGTPSPHDEATALLNMDGHALTNKFVGKTPEQIEALINKVI